MRNNKNSFVFILLLSVLTACKVSKDIVMPPAPLPQNFRNAATTDTTSIADIPWKVYFTETSLQKLISSAIVKNYDMQLALKNIEGAQLVLKQTKWAYLPDARLGVTAGSTRPSDNSLNGLSAKQFLQTTHVEDFNANISLTWEADIWGKIKNQRAGALAAYLQTAEAKKAVQTNIITGVARGFYNLLMLDAQLAIAKKNRALNDTTLRIIRLLYTAGQVTALGVQQAEAQQLAAASLVPQLEQDITIQENALSILSGELPGSIQRNVILAQMDVGNRFSAGIPSDMVSRRPDVKSYELALIRANAQVGIAKANMYPTFSITAGTGINAFRATNWFNVPASLFGIVAGSVAQPLFQKKQLTTAYEVAKVEREKTVIQFRQAVLQAVGEVSDALVKMEKLREAQTIVSNRVNTLQQAITNANMLFSNGMANYLEVITAQSNILQTELELAVVKREQLNTKAELYRSLGGGWKWKKPAIKATDKYNTQCFLSLIQKFITKNKLPTMTKKEIAMKAMKDLFVKRDSTALYRYWASDHTQHNPRMSNGHEGIQEVMPHIPEHFSYDPGIVIEEGNIVMAHSRVVGLGHVPQMIVDIFRFENGKIVEHWDVIQEEVTAYHSKNGNPMTSSPVS